MRCRRRQLEYGAVAGRPTVRGCAIQLAMLAEDQAAPGICGVGASQEAIEYVVSPRAAPRRRQPEYHAAARRHPRVVSLTGTRFERRPAGEGRAVKRAIVIEYQVAVRRG